MLDLFMLDILRKGCFVLTDLILYIVQICPVYEGPTGRGGRGRLDQLHEISREVSRSGERGSTPTGPSVLGHIKGKRHRNYGPMVLGESPEK